MSNQYHVLYQLPCYDAKGLSPAIEMLAQQLVTSGRLRINADNARNFITYSGAGFDKSFSKRELTDPNLLPETKQAIADTLPHALGLKGIAETYDRLLREFKRTGDIPLETELRVARLLCQATHPAVIMLCLSEKVDIFVSYSHNVADLMAIHFWETMGTSGGLQSVSGDGKAVYVSCGGDPFITDEKHKTYTTDGFPALARMMVIAAQELGHFADIIRDAHGHAVGRYSAYLVPMIAREAVHEARQKDRARVAQWQHIASQWGIVRLAKQEEQLAFYRKHRRLSPIRLWHELRRLELQTLIRYYARRRHVPLIDVFPRRLHGVTFWASAMMDCLRDMAFNLAPEADAYRRPDPVEENAIACIEAMARVPQQAIKWGHDVTRLCWPHLYPLYYGQVIPGTIAAYEATSGKRFHFPDQTAA